MRPSEWQEKDNLGQNQLYNKLGPSLSFLPTFCEARPPATLSVYYINKAHLTCVGGLPSGKGMEVKRTPSCSMSSVL